MHFFKNKFDLFKGRNFRNAKGAKNGLSPFKFFLLITFFVINRSQSSFDGTRSNFQIIGNLVSATRITWIQFSSSSWKHFGAILLKGEGNVFIPPFLNEAASRDFDGIRV